MIATFKINNFRSIREMTVDFRFAEGKAPNDYQKWATLPFVEATSNVRLVPCLALFGANASGKTNVLRALADFQRATTRKAVDFFEPNKLQDGKLPTLFELTFFLDGDEFAYTLEYNGNGILKEALAKNGGLLYAVQEGKFSSFPAADENYPNEKLQAIVNVECSDGKGNQIFTFLTRVGQNYTGLNKDFLSVFEYINHRLIILQDNDIPLPNAVDNLRKYYGDNEDKALQAIAELVRKLDIAVKSISIKREKMNKNQKVPYNTFFTEIPDSDQYTIAKVTTYHEDTHGDAVPFDFLNEESNGTQRLAGLVGVMLFALKGGHVLFVDELDCSLHSLLLRELIRMFKDKWHNKKGAQLVFTTHNTDILDDAILRVSEVAIIRKTIQTGTLIRRIVEFKNDGLDVRNVTNFRKQYLKGFYSGVPHPAI